jgi:hypothetical protein
MSSCFAAFINECECFSLINGLKCSAIGLGEAVQASGVMDLADGERGEDDADADT